MLLLIIYHTKLFQYSYQKTKIGEEISRSIKSGGTDKIAAVFISGNGYL